MLHPRCGFAWIMDAPHQRHGAVSQGQGCPFCPNVPLHCFTACRVGVRHVIYHGGVWAQRGHSTNYYVVHPGNTPENHPANGIVWGLLQVKLWQGSGRHRGSTLQAGPVGLAFHEIAAPAAPPPELTCPPAPTHALRTNKTHRGGGDQTRSTKTPKTVGPRRVQKAPPCGPRHKTTPKWGIKPPLKPPRVVLCPLFRGIKPPLWWDTTTPFGE